MSPCSLALVYHSVHEKLFLILGLVHNCMLGKPGQHRPLPFGNLIRVASVENKYLFMRL